MSPENTPCRRSSECLANDHGECYMGQCRCQDGYRGDGLTSCEGKCTIYLFIYLFIFLNINIFCRSSCILRCLERGTKPML